MVPPGHHGINRVTPPLHFEKNPANVLIPSLSTVSTVPSDTPTQILKSAAIPKDVRYPTSCYRRASSQHVFSGTEDFTAKTESVTIPPRSNRFQGHRRKTQFSFNALQITLTARYQFLHPSRGLIRFPPKSSCRLVSA